MGLALVCICWRALMEQWLSFCFMCRAFSNTRGCEGAGCPRRAQGTCRLGGRSAAEGASVQKTSTSPRAWLWQGLYRIAFLMPRRWYRLRTRSYPSHVQRVPQAGGSRPHPCVGPASFVATPSDAPRDAPRGAASDGPYDAAGAVGGRVCSGRWSNSVCRAAVSC